MLRRVPARFGVLLLAAALAAGVSSASPGRGAAAVPPRVAAGAEPAGQPNIVLVLVDDMRTDELQWLDDTRRLVGDHGVAFPKAIAPHPLCCPSRAGLLTGQYAQNNGVQHNRGPYGGIGALRDREDTIPTWLQDVGYRTGYIGKYLNGYQNINTREPGWTSWRALAYGPVARYRTFQFYGDPEPTNGYITTSVSRETVAAVHDFAGQQPFFLYVNHTAPHDLFEGAGVLPPVPQALYADMPVRSSNLGFLDSPSFNEDDVTDLPRPLQRRRVDRGSQVELAKARIRALQSVDDAMENLFAALEQTGELADTWVVFASDNGYLLGEHRLTRKNRLFREVLDVPLLIRGPGIAQVGRASRRVVSLVDLPATFAEISGAAPGHPLDGTSLLPMLRGEVTGWRDSVLVQTGRTRDDGRQPGWQYRGVLTGRYLYAVDVNGRPQQNLLFDRRRDPYEMRNVADDPRYADVAVELDKRRIALQQCAGSNCNRRFGPVPSPD